MSDICHDASLCVLPPTTAIFLDIDGVLMGDRYKSPLADKIREKLNELFTIIAMSLTNTQMLLGGIAVNGKALCRRKSVFTVN